MGYHINMKLFRKYYRDLKDGSGRVELTETENICGWCRVDMNTGEVDLGGFKDHNNDLIDSRDGWEWKKFKLVLSD